MSEKEDKKDVGKEMLGLYLARYQGEAYRQFGEKQEMDFLRPFKFVWFIFADLWRLFPPKKDRPR